MTFQPGCERDQRRVAVRRRNGWCSAAAWMVAGMMVAGTVVSGTPASAQAAGGPVAGTPQTAGAPAGAAQADRTAEPRRMFRRYCIGCHNDRLRTADLSIAGLDLENLSHDAETWEKVVTRLRAGSMPPPGRPRPDDATYRNVAGWLETELDSAWAADPQPGRINAIHRINRTEYRNAVRDLLALDVDVESLLPGDETADGSFDNFAAVLGLSTAHIERYLSVARQVTRLATGLPPPSPGADTFEISIHVVQDTRQGEDLPLGSRGGVAIPYQFPVDGVYRVKLLLRRQYQDYLMGMGWPQSLDVRVDGRLVKRFTVGGSVPGRPVAASYAGDGEPGFAGAVEWEAFMQRTGDANLEVDVPVEAGPHVVGVSFVRQLWEPEGLPQPLQRGRVLTNDQIYMGYAAVRSVEIGGPYLVADTSAETPSRRAIFTCEPPGDEERACATQILSSIARRAFRRPVTDGEVDSLLRFFDEGRAAGSFEAGIQFGLERILVDPDFLLRVYRDPIDLDRTTYALSDLELASRLSFFLWSSIPDEPLLQLAEDGPAERPGCPGAAGAADARRPARHRGHRRGLRRAVAQPAARRRGRRRPGPVSALRRESAQCVRGGGRAVRREHADRGPQRARSARRRLHIRQRAAGAPLRHPGHLRQPVPACDVPEYRSARGAAGGRRAAGHDVVSGPDLAGAAREVAGRQHLRAAGAGAARRRQHRPGGDSRRDPGDDTRKARAAPAEPDVRELSRGDRSARIRPGELRRDRRLARRRRAGPADRQRRHDNRWGTDQRAGGSARAAPRRPGAVSADLDREAPGICSGAAAGALRSARCAADRARRGGVGVSLVGDHLGHRAEPAVHDAGRGGGELEAGAPRGVPG